jgi:phosphate starvation-inducible PhoH-like protein
LADENLNRLRENFASQITVRGDRIIIEGERQELDALRHLLGRLLKGIRDGRLRNEAAVREELQNQLTARPAKVKDEFAIHTPRLLIRPKGINQAEYSKAMDRFDMVIGIGPAGTGKTYIAVAKAVAALSAGKVSRIILTRPAVEAGESLGFLPGDLKDKVDPYLRPLYDALYEMMPAERVRRLIDHQVIEVAPLAFMRGRTLSDAYVILDEAQNTTPGQMKMFLTRLGWNSKAVVDGDVTQIDLARESQSGLVEAQTLLVSIPAIKFIYFDKSDVVRPPLVSEIIKAYESKKNNPDH